MADSRRAVAEKAEEVPQEASEPEVVVHQAESGMKTGPLVTELLAQLEQAMMVQCPPSEHTTDMHMHLNLARVAYNRLQTELKK